MVPTGYRFWGQLVVHCDRLRGIQLMEPTERGCRASKGLLDFRAAELLSRRGVLAPGEECHRHYLDRDKRG